MLFLGSVLFAAQHQMEALGRGVIALRSATTEVHVGWRLLGTDPADIAFNLYRSANGAAPVKLNASPLTATTDFVDGSADATQPNAYFVRPVVDGVEQAASAAASLPANTPVQSFITVPLQTLPGNIPNDASVGDLDGDGEYEIVLKQEMNTRDNSQSGTTGETKLEAYKLNGSLLWRINLGKNIREGAHYTQFLVYDFDGDGRAEVVCKTADGTIDGTGRAIGDVNADYRNAEGYVLRGPEFLTVFDGLTGAALATTNYVPPRNNNPASADVSAWGDNYGNRVDRFLACVAYLDGQRPSIVMCRGYYTRAVLAAWDWRNGQLTQRWVFDSRDGTPGNTAYDGQGAHSITVGDVDGDGRDDIIYGAATIGSDGRGLYSTGLGHGDALHLSDMDPDRPGLEVWMVHEDPGSYGATGLEMHDAKTGAVLVGASGQASDVGRGVAFDIDSRYRGYEMWGARGGLYNAQGQAITATRPGQMNFGIWWDADPLREILDNITISKWNETTNSTTTLLTATGTASNNGTKATPVLSADILGDWREEVILRTTDNQALRIYSTTIPATNRLYTLMHDRTYRLAIAWQNTAYNQPPHPGYFLGHGMTPPPVPDIPPPPLNASTSQLAGLSVRANAGSGPETLIVGFITAGSGDQNVLVRGLGPALIPQGVTTALPDPKLELFGAGGSLAVNDDWAINNTMTAAAVADAMVAMGAYTLPNSSRDAVLVPRLGAGGYTAHVSAASGPSGTALMEVYSAINPSGRLTALSARARVGSGEGRLIAGFVIRGAEPKTVLIRAVGPSLVGVAGVLADPQLELYRGGTRIATNNDWGDGSGATAATFASVGLPLLPPSSKDAALLVTLLPGPYTAHVYGTGDTTGVALIEVYEMP